MLPPRRLDERQIRKFAREHLAWEMDRFRRGAALWGRRDGEEGAMLRESCLIHLRLLLDFFYPRGASKKYPDDVRPGHFVADGHGNRPEPPWLQDYRDRLDQLLVHLTYKRLDWAEDRRMVWKPEQQFAHVELMWGQFLSSLPESRRRWFSTTLQFTLGPGVVAQEIAGLRISPDAPEMGFWDGGPRTGA